MIYIPPLSISTAYVGYVIEFFCISRGSPPDTFTWRKDNDPTVLQSTRITAADYTSTSAVFTAYYFIGRVTASDNGTYTCIITNPIGSDSYTRTFIVIGKSVM